MQLLLEVFANPGIVKVLHGADSDVLWLQRDFGLYIVNMFDTGQAARKLMFSRFGLGFLLEHICEVKTDKSFQLADWRVRPLSPDHIKYARMDTHYLLHIYDYLKIQLQSKAAQLKLSPGEYIRDVFNRSKEICMKCYVKPDLRYVGINGTELFDKKQRRILEHITRWRDEVARSEDESPGYIMAARKIMMVVSDPPNDLKGLTRVVQSANFVKKFGEKVLEIVRKALDVKEEEVESKKEVLVKAVDKVRVPYVKKFEVAVNGNRKITVLGDSNTSVPKEKHGETIRSIQISLNSVFDKEKSLFFNKAKPKAKENTKKIEAKVEDTPMSIEEKYCIPMKNKTPSTRKIKQNLVKKQKITEKKNIKVGWLDNVELLPVKRKNLFKKKHN